MIKIIINFLFGFRLFFNAVLFVPQAIKLYKAKSATGHSLFMFCGFNIIQILTIWHAYFEKDWVLMVGFVLAFFTCGAVTLQLILYRLLEGPKTNKMEYMQ